MPVNEVLIVFQVYIRGQGETTPTLVSIIKTKMKEWRKSSVRSHYIKVLMCGSPLMFFYRRACSSKRKEAPRCCRCCWTCKSLTFSPFIQVAVHSSETHLCRESTNSQRYELQGAAQGWKPWICSEVNIFPLHIDTIQNYDVNPLSMHVCCEMHQSPTFAMHFTANILKKR